MLIRRLDECVEFTAGDHTRLREILHPGKQPVSIRYSLAHALLAPGESSTKHCLNSSEVYYIMSGHGRMNIDSEHRDVATGATVYIPPGALQWIENIGSEPLAFLCIVDPAWQPADETVLSDRGISRSAAVRAREEKNHAQT
jgi:mannose-6-phosphate isomerase-like protein (cupin superfamily)